MIENQRKQNGGEVELGYGLASIENQVSGQWNASTEREALLLIDIMKNNPSIKWRSMMAKAESHEIKHWRLLLQNSDRIYESIAEAIADNDKLVGMKKMKKGSS